LTFLNVVICALSTFLTISSSRCRELNKNVERSVIFQSDIICQAFAAKYWVQLGAPPEKLNVGLALYGRSFTLKNAADHGVGSPAKGGGKAGKFTQEEGYLSFYEVLAFIRR
jgi:GH18 family chitinase